MSASNAVRLLWTGGWDSTFRLLDLLLIRKKPVEPYYLINSGRLSFSVELRTLRKIRGILLERFPESRSLLLPTRFKDISELTPNPAITAQFKRLRKLRYLGEQYDWLARFADESGLSDLELSIHKEDKAHALLEGHVVREANGDDTYYRLQDDLPNPDLRLFKYYRFPLFDTSKLEMQRITQEHGFRDIMEQTWFCHRPLKDGASCGTCGPCRYAREEGFGRRISLIGHLRYHSLYRAYAVASKFLNLDRERTQRLRDYLT